MKYPLQDLLRVRNFREENAANALTVKRRELEQAEQLVAQRKKELEDYIQWRINRESEMYQEVMKKSIHLQALDDLKQDIQILRDKQNIYEDQITKAEKALQEAQQALEQARVHHLQAVKDRKKIDEHKELWAQEVAKISESNQEKELEDFRVRELDD
ncbi:hypothetical protein GC197_08990 [bacterium]|nr:hypothetical protein [bacterium]